VCPEENIRAHVDIGAELKKISFDGLPSQCRPLQAPADYIATEALKLQKKHNVIKPFPFANLIQFMPSFVNSVITLAKDGRLPMWLWAVAFDKYAISAACAGQWAYTSSRAHFENCVKVAVRASLEQRDEVLGQFYDEVTREAWAEASKRNDEGFYLDEVSVQLDADLLAEAKACCVLVAACVWIVSPV
jgi:hypothetical protein